MKKIAFLFFFFASSAFAQKTVVSGTVTDTSGLPYSGASLTATLSTPAGTLGAYLGGAQIAGTVGPVSLDSTGSFLLNLADNTQIRCANAQGQLVTCVPQTTWNFAVTLSPGVGPPLGKGPQTCNVAALTISGPSQSVTSSFNACPAISSVAAAPAVSGNGQIIFNNNGALAGSSMIFDGVAGHPIGFAGNVLGAPPIPTAGSNVGWKYGLFDNGFFTGVFSATEYYKLNPGAFLSVGTNNPNNDAVANSTPDTAAAFSVINTSGKIFQVNCTSAASPAVCAGAANGSVVIAAGATTVTVNTTAVAATSLILLQEDDSLGTKLGVTCNTTSLGATKISARVAGTSFTITTASAPAVNPACLSFLVQN